LLFGFKVYLGTTWVLLGVNLIGFLSGWSWCQRALL